MDSREDIRDRRRYLRRNATFPERLLWSRLRKKQTGFKFRRQESIGPYIVDFLCCEVSLVVEIDGVVHTDPVVMEKDKHRERYIKNEGYRVVRYSDQEVIENVDGVFMHVMEICTKLKNEDMKEDGG